MSIGIVYMIASALGFSVMSVLVKLASPRIPTGEIILARAIVTLVISYVMIRRAGLSPWGSGAPGVRGKLLTRGLLGFCGLAGYYLALARLPIADATILQNTVPLLTAMLAWWLLGEKVGPWIGIALACGTAGVLLVVRPSGDGIAHEHLAGTWFGLAHHTVGVATALGGALCSAFAYVTVRKLARTEHPLVIVMVFPLVATPLAIPWAALDLVIPSLLEIALLIAIGIATQVGQVFLTMGLAAERAASASAVNYLQVCFAVIWQVVIFHQSPAVATLGGAGLIIAGTIVTAYRSKGAPARAHTPPPPSP